MGVVLLLCRLLVQVIEAEELVCYPIAAVNHHFELGVIELVIDDVLHA